MGMDINYSECSIDENVGGMGFILRHPNGDVVREPHGVPIGFQTRRAAAAWLRSQAKLAEEARWEEIERQQGR